MDAESRSDQEIEENHRMHTEGSGRGCEGKDPLCMWAALAQAEGKGSN